MRVEISLGILEHDEPYLDDREYMAEVAKGLVDILNGLPESLINEKFFQGSNSERKVYLTGFDVFHPDALDKYADRIVPDDISGLESGETR